MMKSVLILIAFSAVGSALAQEGRGIEQALAELDRTVTLSNPSISPDGRWITWTEEQSNGTQRSFLLNRSDANAKPIEFAVPGAAETSKYHGFTWSKDSTQVAFFANLASTQDQIFVLTAANGTYRKLTDLNGYATSLAWSPDSRQLAFLYAESGGGGGPLEAEPAATGQIGSAIHNQRLTLIPADGGALRQVSPADLNVYEFDWFPDGTHFAAIAAPGPADNNWWVAKLYRLDSASGEMKLLWKPAVEQQIAIPRCSPDGKRLAVVAGLMSDEGFVGGDVFLIAADGGQPRDITANSKVSAASLKWRDEHTLLVSEAIDGGGAISTLDINTGRRNQIWTGPNELKDAGNDTNLAIASDGRTAVALESTWQQPPEVFAGAMGDWQQLTHLNTGQQPQWSKAESIHWNSGPYRVQGWLIYPEHFDAGKRYPMVVEIHGGPTGERSAAWPTSNFDMTVLAGMGYFVFFPNPRGSTGQGEGFTRANVKDFGGGDLRDILAGVDAVTTKVPVDPNRIGVTGWSYGGFMTMWTVTQTHRFRAAVAGAGIADWLSYYGENSIDEWMIPFFGASVYDDPGVYAKSSPINFIKQVKTPTLVLVGERDGECPAPQSFEFWHALQALHVPSELVVYAGQGHRFRDPKDRVDRMRRTLGWFDQYLGSVH